METVQGEEPAVLINVFEVEEGKEEEFRARLRECAEHLKQQDGYMSHKLHESLDAGARFRYINTAVWRSPRHFQAAVTSPEFRAIAQRIPGKPNVELYRVVDQTEQK